MLPMGSNKMDELELFLLCYDLLNYIFNLKLETMGTKQLLHKITIELLNSNHGFPIIVGTHFMQKCTFCDNCILCHLK